VFDELAIYDRALNPPEIAQLAARPAPLPAGATVVDHTQVAVAIKALDDGGAIVGMQLGVDGHFGDPEVYTEQSSVQLPEAPGPHTIAARVFDRAGNSTTVSTTVTLAPAQPPQIALAELTDLGATVTITSPVSGLATEAQISSAPSFADAAWQPLPLRAPWLWPPGGPRAVWVRLRNAAGSPGPAFALGPDGRRMWLPIIAH
jgi:hypothetical protein